MCEYAPIIIALAIIVLIVLVIYLGVSYAFEIYENRRLQEEIDRGFHYTIGFNKSLAEDVKFLEDLLRPYRRLANKYGCGDAIELEKLLMDLQDRLYRKDTDR
jgi:hypothetical protein